MTLLQYYGCFLQYTVAEHAVSRCLQRLVLLLVLQRNANHKWLIQIKVNLVSICALTKQMSGQI